MNRPLKGKDHDVILYLKQQIPTAAERSGIIQPDPRLPGRRCAEDLRAMTDPVPFLNGWSETGGRSYWVSFKEPWSDELDFQDVKDADALFRAARIWGTVAGAAHRGKDQPAMILPRLTPTLSQALNLRADAYVRQLQKDFTAFTNDPRVTSQTLKVDAAIRQAEASVAR